MGIIVLGGLDDAAKTLLRLAAALPTGDAFEADNAVTSEAANKLHKEKLVDLVDVQTKVILEGPDAGGYRIEFFRINDKGRRLVDELGGALEVDDLDKLEAVGAQGN